MNSYIQLDMDHNSCHCMPRTCKFCISHLTLQTDAESIIIAVKLHASKRSVRTVDIPLKRGNGNASMAYVDLNLTYNITYPHYLKKDTNYLYIYAQRRKKYKTRTILGYKTLAYTCVDLSSALQRALSKELPLYAPKDQNASAALQQQQGQQQQHRHHNIHQHHRAIQNSHHQHHHHHHHVESSSLNHRGGSGKKQHYDHQVIGSCRIKSLCTQPVDVALDSTTTTTTSAATMSQSTHNNYPSVEQDEYSSTTTTTTNVNNNDDDYELSEYLRSKMVSASSSSATATATASRPLTHQLICKTVTTSDNSDNEINDSALTTIVHHHSHTRSNNNSNKQSSSKTHTSSQRHGGGGGNGGGSGGKNLTGKIISFIRKLRSDSDHDHDNENENENEAENYSEQHENDESGDVTASHVTQASVHDHRDSAAATEATTITTTTSATYGGNGGFYETDGGMMMMGPYGDDEFMLDAGRTRVVDDFGACDEDDFDIDDISDYSDSDDDDQDQDAYSIVSTPKPTLQPFFSNSTLEIGKFRYVLIQLCIQFYFICKNNFVCCFCVDSSEIGLLAHGVRLVGLVQLAALELGGQVLAQSSSTVSIRRSSSSSERTVRDHPHHVASGRQETDTHVELPAHIAPGTHEQQQQQQQRQAANREATGRSGLCGVSRCRRRSANGAIREQHQQQQQQQQRI